MSFTSLADGSEFVLDGTHGSPTRTESGIPVLSAQNVRDGRLDFNTDRYTNEGEYETFRSRLNVQAGDVLLTIVGSIGRAAVITEARPLVFQRSVAVIRPRPSKLDPRFLYHATQSRDFQRQLTQATNQSSQAGVYLGRLKKITVPLPHIDEQRRIAKALDRADELRTRRRQGIAHLYELTRSTFLDMFGDPVRNERSWPRVLMSSLLERIHSGHSPHCLNRPARDEEWGVLKLGAVTSCEFAPDENKALPPGVIPRQEHTVREGDVLFSRKNTRELVAASALVRATPPKLLLPDLIFRLEPYPDAPLNKVFLQQLLVYPSKRRQIQSLAGGSAGSMPNISKARLMAAEVELPPLPLQREFARRIDAIEKLRAAQRASLAELDALFASLQDRAFRGLL
ncbi:restriction endonuclease subunit S [Micromonospora carbonacea]|uniref:restriction endonuclease subunit S n=1 Tax=Micromonospora carbonacea TaxID=47853 RepID=UPI003D97C15E